MSSLNNKSNAWVTGHSGFIGKQLIKDLRREFEVFKISRNNILESNKFFTKNIHINKINKKLLKNFKINYLFHLATLYKTDIKTPEDINNIIESNLLFGLRLFSILENNFFSKILLTQSYLELQKKYSMTLYTQTKSIFANEIEKMAKKKVIKIYLYDTFGLKDKREKLINIWLKKLTLNKPINVFSKKTIINLSSKAYVSKILSHIDLIDPGTYEIRSEVEMNLIDLFYFLKNITQSKSKLIIQNKQPVKIPKKYDNLSQILKIKYNFTDFEKDIITLLNKDF